MTTSVIGGAGDLVLWEVAQKHIACKRRGWFLFVGNLVCHRSVDAHRPGADGGIEQHSNVAMSYQPFRMTLIILCRDAVQQMNGAIASSGADNGLDTVIVERP